MASDLTNLLSGVFNDISVSQQGKQSLFEIFGTEFDDGAEVPDDVYRREDGRFRLLGVLNALLERAGQERMLMITDLDQVIWIGNLNEYEKQIAAGQTAGRDSGPGLGRSPEGLRVDDRSEAAGGGLRVDDAEADVFFD